MSYHPDQIVKKGKLRGATEEVQCGEQWSYALSEAEKFFLEKPGWAKE